MPDVEDVAEELADAVAEEADQTDKWTQEESAEIFEGVADICKMRAATIREEIANG